jgi:hypothetical protein
MKTHFMPRDEQTTGFEGASYRWAYLTLAFGTLLSVAYRAFILQENSWDLLALVLLSGGVMTIYQGRHQLLSRRWVLVTGGAMLLAAVIGVTLMLVR